MPQECLMSGCQRKFSMENCKKESAHKVAKRNATKTPLKPRLRISIFQLSPGNRLLRIEQSGVASSIKGASQFEAKRICEAERKRKGMKARAKGPSSDSTSPNSLALFATDSLEPRLAYTTIFFFFYSKSPPLTFRRTVYRRSYGNLCRILVCVSSIYNGDKYLHC